MSVNTNRYLKVFLVHAKNDKPKTRKLYEYLRRNGIDAWLDEAKLLPGQRWEIEIPKALRSSDAIIVCLSKASITKEGYVQKEINFALDIVLEKPEGTIFLIPARFEECDVPSRLASYQWVDLFRERGGEWLLRGLDVRASELGIQIGRAPLQDDQDTKLQSISDSVNPGKAYSLPPTFKIGQGIDVSKDNKDASILAGIEFVKVTAGKFGREVRLSPTGKRKGRV